MTGNSDISTNDTRVTVPTLLPGVGMLIVILALVVFQPGLVALVQAWGQPDYSHGPLAVLTFFLLVLMVHADVPTTGNRRRTRVFGWLILVFSLFAGIISRKLSLGELSAMALTFWLFGVHLCLASQRAAERALPTYLLLLTAIPFSTELFWQVQTYLQMLTAVGSITVVQALGYHAELSNNVIDVDGIFLHIAQACSGFRYILPILSFAAILATLTGSTWRIKTMIVVVAVPIAIAMNVLRVIIIVIIVDIRESTGHVESFAHFLEGWIIFVATVGLLLFVAALASRMTGRTEPLGEWLDLDIGKSGRALRRLSRAIEARDLVTVMAPLLLAATLLAALPTPNGSVPGETSILPARLGDWVRTRHLTEGTIDGLPAAQDSPSAVSTAIYVRAMPYDLLRLATLRRRDENREPSLPVTFVVGGDGWEVEWMEYAHLPLANQSNMAVAEVVIVNGFQRQLVLYWYSGPCGTAATLVRSRLVSICAPGAPPGQWIRLSGQLGNQPNSLSDVRQDLRAVAIKLVDQAS